MKPPAILVDVNGCLGDCTNRKHFLDQEPRDWDGFFRHMMIDKPDDFMHRLVNAQRDHPFYCKAILITGSPEKYRPLMQEWLQINNIDYHELYMRGDYQFIKGFEFKEKLVKEVLEPKYEIIRAFDDRDECANMYRSLGIKCWATNKESYTRVDKSAPREHNYRRKFRRERVPKPK